MTVFKIRSDDAYSLVYHDVKQLSLKTSDRKALLRGLSANVSVKDFWVELEGMALFIVSPTTTPHCEEPQATKQSIEARGLDCHVAWGSSQ